MRKHIRPSALILALYAAIPPTSSNAEWQTDGVPVCTAVDAQMVPVVVPAGGGSIVVWNDARLGAGNGRVYAQRLDASGVPQWAPDGVPIRSSSHSQSHAVAVADLAGGAIIAHTENGDVYAQHVSSTGALLWGSSGVVLCDAAGTQRAPVIVSDFRSGVVELPGAIVAWEDHRFEVSDIFAQAVRSNGEVQWTADGVPVCTAEHEQDRLAIVTDGMGTIHQPKGAIIAWADNRNPEPNDIYAQRLNAGGTPQWESDGRPVCTDPAYQSDPALAFIAPGSAIISWTDLRTSSFNIYAQRENNSGPAWPIDGVPVCQAAFSQLNPVMLGDLQGGAFIVWEDTRGLPFNYDIFAQRVDGTGALLWPATGVSLCTTPGDQQRPRIVGDLAGGLICVWDDEHGSEYDIYAQHADGSGTTYWGPAGQPVCVASSVQYHVSIAGDGAGGAVVAWADQRNGVTEDIYANHVATVGGPSSVDPISRSRTLQTFRAHPNPTSDFTTMHFNLPVSHPVTAHVVSMDGRLIRTLVDRELFPSGLGALHWDGTDFANRRVPSGIYMIRLNANGEAGVCRVSVLR